MKIEGVQNPLENIHRCPLFNDKNIVEAVLDEDQENKAEEEAKNAEKKKWTAKDWLYLGIMSTIFIFILVVTILESKNVVGYIKWISGIIEEAVNNESAWSYLMFLAFQLSFHLLFVPGLTFFNVLVGYYMKNTLKGFLIVYITSMISCILTFYVSRFVFRDYFEKTLFKKPIFQHMLQLSSTSPWKASTVTRYYFTKVGSSLFLWPTRTSVSPF